MPKVGPVQVAAPAIETAAGLVMAELRSALGDLARALPDDIRRAVDLERSLNLDKKLAWQVVRLIQSVGLAEVANVPSRPSVRRLLESARRRRVPRETVERVRAAFEQFESLAVLHGGDREGLVSVIQGVTGENGGQFELKVRKSLFRGNAHAWGVQARMSARTGIFVPRAGTDRIEDVAMVIGDIGLVRRRQSDPLVMLWWLKTGDAQPSAGSNGGDAQTEAGLRLLPEFSSRPLPRMLPRQARDGTAETELVFPPGRTGAITLYSTQTRRSVDNEPGSAFFGRTVFTMPLETMVWELLVPVGWSNPATARAAIYGRRHHPEQVYEERTQDLMPQRESLDYLGVHENVPPLAGEPGHSGAVREVLERNGWLETRFDVYRCRVEYPLLHSMLVAKVDPAAR